MKFFQEISSLHSNVHIAHNAIQFFLMNFCELGNLLDNLFVHVDFHYKRICILRNLLSMFFQNI